MLSVLKMRELIALKTTTPTELRAILIEVARLAVSIDAHDVAALLDQAHDLLDDGICPRCSGSGEGMCEGSRCHVCHGSGVAHA